LRVLVTRPCFDAARTAEKLAALGHEALIDPVIEIEPLPFDAAVSGVSALVFTSANAVRVAAAQGTLKQVPVFAVGERTAEVAGESGFAIAGVAAGDVSSLGELIAAKLPPGQKALHLAGEDRAGDLPNFLSRNGIGVETRIIYRARASENLRPETVGALKAGRIGAVLHYSERSAASFVRLVEKAALSEFARKTRHYCISPAAASPLASLGAQVTAATVPSEAALLDLLER
jgi:uroporphyrinogen-III synthase